MTRCGSSSAIWIAFGPGDMSLARMPAPLFQNYRSELKMRREISYGLRAAVDGRSTNFLKAECFVEFI